MNPDYSPFGNASERLLAITLGSSNPVRDLTGRERRRAAARAARKASNRISITDRRLQEVT
jgi:hypothetical protein